MKLVLPDLISPSYLPAIAAVELGYIAQRGVDMELELHFPVTDAIDALRTGEVDVVAGAAHVLFHGAPDGGGVRLLAAISHNTYWFLVVRSEFGSISLADLSGLRVGVASGPDEAFVQMLVDAAVDPMTAAISEDDIANLVKFARSRGKTTQTFGLDDLVFGPFRKAWVAG